MAAIDYYTRELHAYIDCFKSRMSARLREVQAPDLLGLYKEMAILCSKVRSLCKSHVVIISLEIFSFMQILPQPPTMVFDLLMENEAISIIVAKRCRVGELQDLTINYSRP